jgi:DNA replication and repair protein RecF
MILRSLKLENFRNYKKYETELDSITVFVGPNGIGKTNLLEAIYFLSIGKSYRVHDDKKMIKWEEEYCRVLGKNETDTSEIFVGASQLPAKSIKINGIKRKITDLFGKLSTVVFSPESIDIITGPPKTKRKFLDLVLAQTSRDYLISLIELQKILRQRNHLLFNIKIGQSKTNELKFWNDELIKCAKPIIKKRIELIDFINQKIADFYKQISGNEENLKINYIPTINDENNIKDLLDANLTREIKESSTLCGPHRDNFEVAIDDKDVNTFASRGEIRSIIFALKIIELEYLKTKKCQPLLLLDDIFSELDRERREKLSNLVLSLSTVITTTDIDFLGHKLKNKAKMVKL